MREAEVALWKMTSSAIVAVVLDMVLMAYCPIQNVFLRSATKKYN